MYILCIHEWVLSRILELRNRPAYNIKPWLLSLIRIKLLNLEEKNPMQTKQSKKKKRIMHKFRHFPHRKKCTDRHLL